MRIIKASKQVSNEKERKRIANLNCNKCPCCGETESDLEWMSRGRLDRGIGSGIISEKWSLFHGYTRRDVWHCNTCGASWESEPY